MIDRYGIQDLIDSRTRGEGFSIDSDEDMRRMYEQGIDRLSDAIEKWTSLHEPKDVAWTHSGDTPMTNTGYHFANDTFVASAYDWSDNPMDLNFYHFASGVDISWYKHAWRGPYGHSEATRTALKDGSFPDIIDDCIRSLEDTYANEMAWEGLFDEQPDYEDENEDEEKTA